MEASGTLADEDGDRRGVAAVAAVGAAIVHSVE